MANEWRKRYHSYGPALSIEYTVTYCIFVLFLYLFEFILSQNMSYVLEGNE